MPFGQVHDYLFGALSDRAIVLYGWLDLQAGRQGWHMSTLNDIGQDIGWSRKKVGLALDELTAADLITAERDVRGGPLTVLIHARLDKLSRGTHAPGEGRSRSGRGAYRDRSGAPVPLESGFDVIKDPQSHKGPKEHKGFSGWGRVLTEWPEGDEPQQINESAPTLREVRERATGLLERACHAGTRGSEVSKSKIEWTEQTCALSMEVGR